MWRTLPTETHEAPPRPYMQKACRERPANGRQTSVQREFPQKRYNGLRAVSGRDAGGGRSLS